MAYRDYGVANACCIGNFGNFQTITQAMASPQAVSGAVFYLYPQIYTESFTLPAGITLTTLPGSEQVGSVTIIGTITFSAAATATISNIRLISSSSTSIVFSGAGASNLILNNCYLLSNGFTCINYSNSNASSILSLTKCSGDILTNGFATYTMSSPGLLSFDDCAIFNTGLSTTANTNSAGTVVISNSALNNPVTTSGTGVVNIGGSQISTVALNVTCLNAGGAAVTGGGGLVNDSILTSGTASALNITSQMNVDEASIYSTNLFAISGNGILVNGVINFGLSTGIQGTLTRQYISTNIGALRVASSLEMQANSTLQVDSGALIDIQSGAILQVDAGAITRLPLTGLLVGHGAGNAVNAIALTTNGQIPIGGALGPVAATLTAGSGITITNAANSITISQTNPSGIPWTDSTSATQALVVDSGYITDRGAGVAYTLPATAVIGDTIKIVGKSGIATITPNANQQILIGSASGTVGVTGTAVATNAGDCAELICVTAGASTVWRFASFVGNWTLT